MKKFITKLLLLSIPVVLASVLILAGPYDKKFAYRYLQGDYQMATWIYDRIFEREDPIDVAFIGTSHTLYGVNDSLIELNISRQLGKKVRVTNLGLPHFGTNVQYAIIKDLFKAKKPKLLVLEVREVEARFSHFGFPIIADGEDILLPELIPNVYLFRDYGYALQSRITYLKEELLPVERQYPKLNLTYNHGFKVMPYNRSLAALLQEEQQQRAKPMFYLGESFKEIEFNLAKEYIAKIYQLTKEHEVKLIFLYLPYYNVPVARPAEYAFYNQMGEVWLTPPGILKDPSKWADLAHLNAAGATELSNWLSKELVGEARTLTKPSAIAGENKDNKPIQKPKG